MNRTDVQEMIKQASPLELELVWIPRIMEKQTSAEIQAEETKEKNNVGLNGYDGHYIGSIFHQIEKGSHLTDKQVDAIKRLLPKYANQYLNMMAERGGKIEQ